MSLYEFNASVMNYARIQKGGSKPMTAEAYDKGVERLRALGLKDMKV